MTTRGKTAALLGLAALGAATGYGVGRLMKQTGTALQGWSDPAALFLAVVFLTIGAIVLSVTVNRASASRMVGGDIAQPASPVQLSFYRQQAVVLLCAGLMLALPVLASTLTADSEHRWRASIMLIIAATFLVQTGFNLVVWRQADEFVRRMVSESASLCFWILQAALFLWAAAERLGLVVRLSSWDCIVILMAVYLVVSAMVSVRLGVR